MRIPFCQFCFTIVAIVGLPVAFAQEAHPSKNPPYVIREDLLASRDPATFEMMTFNYFVDVDTNEKAEPGSQSLRLQRTLKLDEAAAQSFLEYIRRSVLEFAIFSKRSAREQCNARNDVATAADLAQAFSSIDNSIAKRKAELVQGVNQVLSQADRLILSLYLSKHMVSVSDQKIDWIKFVAETGQRPADVMQRLCASQ